MSENKWEKGGRYINAKGEEFEYIEKVKRERAVYHLVRFVKSNNYQYIHTSVFNNPSRMKDASRPYVAGVGYATGTEQEPFSPQDNVRAYEIWTAMINRCYSRGGGMRSYKDVEVAEEWHNFTNFLAWYKKEVYDGSIIRRYQLALDKDLFGGNSRMYSPETCCFLPKSINSILVGIDFDDYTRDSAKRVYHLEVQLSSYGRVLSSRAREYLSEKVRNYSLKYYRLVGFTLKELFAEVEVEVPKVDLDRIYVYGYLEYDKHIYKFYTLKELKEFVHTLECEEKADRVAKICQGNIMREGKHRKLISQN